jgi:hypothetical protein
VKSHTSTSRPTAPARRPATSQTCSDPATGPPRQRCVPSFARKARLNAVALRSGEPTSRDDPKIRAQRGSRRRDRDAPDEGRAGVGRRGVRRRITPEAITLARLPLAASGMAAPWASGCRNRTKPAVGQCQRNDSAEYNFRFGAEEKLAVGLAGVARVVLNALIAVETATVALAVGANSQR